jgi:hypothetical protein
VYIFATNGPCVLKMEGLVFVEVTCRMGVRCSSENAEKERREYHLSGERRPILRQRSSQGTIKYPKIKSSRLDADHSGGE